MTRKKKKDLEQKIESVGGPELELPKTESKKRTRQDFAPTNFLLLVAADVVAAAKRLRCCFFSNDTCLQSALVGSATTLWPTETRAPAGNGHRTFCRSPKPSESCRN